MLYEKMYIRKHQLEKEVSSLKDQLLTYPEGTLICVKNSNYNKWYLKTDQKSSYLSKKNRSKAEVFAYKKYLTLSMNDKIHEIKAIDFYLRHSHPSTEYASQKIFEDPSYCDLLSTYISPTSVHLREWQNAPFDQNPKYKEHLIHKSCSGHMVRSKSEAIIDSFLFLNQIPFRYECALDLDDHIFYPDFTIRHPQNKKLFLWEHFGMMDDKSYSANAFSKLQILTAHGYIPSINLITTFETQEHPLNSEMVTNTINQYFLS